MDQKPAQVDKLQAKIMQADRLHERIATPIAKVFGVFQAPWLTMLFKPNIDVRGG